MNYNLNFRKYIIVFIFFLSNFSKAQIEEKTLEIVTPNDQTSEILKLAEKEAVYQLISDMLGKDQFEKVKSSIDKKVLPQSKNFILLTKVIETEPTEDKQFLNKVLIRFSKKTLKNILISSHLFYLDYSADRILTLIEFKDEKNRKVYRWWNENVETPTPIQDLYSNLQSLFLKYGFYAVHPTFSQYHFMIPKKLKFNKLNVKTAQKLAEFFQSGLIILGSITLEPLSDSMSQVIWDLTLYNSIYLRELSTYKSRTKVPQHSWDFLKTNHWAKNFAMEMKSIYEKGVLSSQLFTITLEGSLNHLERETLKKSLEKTPNINNLKINVISAKQIVYNADVNAQGTQILQQVKKLNVLDFKLSPYLQRENHLVIKVDK